MSPLTALALAALLIMPIPAMAQTQDFLATARQSLADKSQKSTLTTQVVTFVSAKATGFGMYETRGSNVFKPGEPLLFYIEPLGYKFKTVGDTSTFGIAMDIELVSSSGTSLYRQDDFMNQGFKSHHMNQELMLNGTVTLDGASPGDYVMVLTLHDKIGEGSSTAKLPFVIR